jgi:hypothetical protein
MHHPDCCTAEKVGYNSESTVAKREPVRAQTVRRQLLTTFSFSACFRLFSATQELEPSHDGTQPKLVAALVHPSNHRWQPERLFYVCGRILSGAM